MQCNHQKLLHGGTVKQMMVPCGQCIACRINRTQEWAVRIMHELGYHDNASFLTLTYEDTKIPIFSSVVKKDLQDFIKRLRSRHVGQLRYFACGEYGDKTGRPHYHAIVFGLPQDEDLVRSVWGKGHVMVGNVTFESARYVTGYIQKKLSGKEAPIVYQDREPPFQLQSSGIGRKWAEDNKSYLMRNEYITIKGKPFPVPRYYRKILDIDFQERLEDYIKEHELDVRNFKAERGVTPYTDADFTRAQRIHREHELISKQNMKESKL